MGLEVSGTLFNTMQAFDADRAIASMMQKQWPRSEYMTGNRPMLPEEIKDRWERNRQEAALAGAWTHLHCECVLNGGYIDGHCPEMNLFRQFLGQVPPLLAYRTEWCVFSSQEQLAGMIDFAAQDADGNLVFLACILQRVSFFFRLQTFEDLLLCFSGD